MNYEELNLALKSLGKVPQIWNYGKMLYDLAGTLIPEAVPATAGTLADTAVASGLGISEAAPGAAGVGAGGLVMAPYALASIYRVFEGAEAAKRKQRIAQRRAGQMNEASRALGSAFRGPGEHQNLKQWLDSPVWGGGRVGDILYNLGLRNLRGEFMEGQQVEHGSGVPVWAPNEKFKSLVAGLGEMGYGGGIQRDTADLLRYSGGWLPQKTKLGLPVGGDIQRGVEYWDKTLSRYADVFSNTPRWASAEIPGVLSREDIASRYAGIYNDPAYLQRLKNDNSLYGGGHGYGGVASYIPDIQQIHGWSDDDLMRAWQEYQDQQQAFNAFQMQEGASGGP